MIIIKFHEWTCKVQFSKYADNARHAITLVDNETHEPIARVTVNLPDANIADDEVIIKDWSENKGILHTFIDEGLLIPTEKAYISGFELAPVCQMTDKLISEIPDQ